MASSWVTGFSIICVLSLHPVPTFTWDTDLELFDLVEEIPQNFYEFLSLEQDASSADIRKAYRRLSLTLHPDKNKDENAELQFRQLVAIYEVLKDDERRQRYDDILVNGLPDWRQPVFYYRRVRKMSNAELGILLFLILTVGHYAVIWSIYLEKQLDELLSKKKREKKKKTSNKSPDELKAVGLDKNERSSEKPHWQDILPLKLGIWLYLTMKYLPHLVQDAKRYYEDYKEMKMKEKEAAQAQAEQEALQKEKRPKVKKPKVELPVYKPPVDGDFTASYDQATSIEEIEDQMDDWLENKKRQKKKDVLDHMTLEALEWTEEDLGQLTRCMAKFPGGTPGRWEKIAHELGRSVADVISKVKQVKDCVTNTSGLVKLSELRSGSQVGKSSRPGAPSDSIITQREDEPPEEPMGGEDGEGGLRRRRTNRTEGEEREREKEKAKGRRQKDFDHAAAAAAAAEDDSGDEKKLGRERTLPSEDVWTQNQQRLLELALQQFPRGTSERWDKIARVVPGKSKEECMIRYKLLAELVQKKKQAKS